jgi:carbonic anhydrase
VPVTGSAEGEGRTSAREALARLQEGNRRFVSHGLHSLLAKTHRGELVAGQKPFAVVLGCSDSRVPVEIIFDQGPGDLFVIRVAGNIVAPSQIGSVEFAAAQFETPLVVVLGHSRCGAVRATLDEIRRPGGAPGGVPHSIHSIVDRIRPSVENLVGLDRGEDEERLFQRAVRANIRASAGQLRTGSPMIRSLIQEEGLIVLGAEYSLETGVVDFFDGLPGLRG